MCYPEYSLEHTISHLEGEIASLSDKNKKLEEELEGIKKVVEGQNNVFKNIQKILEDKSCGFNGAMKLYVKTVNETIIKMLEKEGVINNG